jgi:ribulose-bisphosphate carboxylase large chain
MKNDDLRGFFSDGRPMDMEQYVVLTYRFECVTDPEEAAAHLCQEQSTAQWKRPGTDEDFRVSHGAKILDLRVHCRVPTPRFSVLSQRNPESSSCTVVIAHPHTNFGPRIPNLLTAACGEGAFFSPGIAAIKLMDVAFPPAYLAQFPGPRFGIEGLRAALGIHGRPFFFGVVKPNLGLSPGQFAALGAEAWQGGLDVAKDDEMLSDSPWSPLAERVRLMTAARRAAERATGEKKMYLVNITDEVDRVLELLALANRGGEGTAVMLNSMSIGLSAIRMVRARARLPIVGHFAGTAPSAGVDSYGIHSRVITMLQRIAGCDVVIFPGFGERMKSADDEVMENIRECTRPLGGIKPALPVPAGSNWAGSLVDLHDRIGSADFGIVPGRAVFDHPQGPHGGARGLRQAWDAIAAGQTLREYAESHEELRVALAAQG